jgi:FkbM family methyltransferase
MTSQIKRIVRHLFHPLAKRMGYSNINSNSESTERGHDKDSLLDIFYDTLHSIGFKPQHIIDVGANKGDWTRKAVAKFPNCRFTLLEPQSWLKPCIQDLLDSNANISFNAVGAGKQSGSFKFTVLDRDDSSSFSYTAQEAQEMGFKQIDIPVITINELISQQNLPAPDIIKIDAEGLDIEVLDGASDLFGKTEVFLVEAGVVNKKFANSFQELVNYMDQKGYRLFEITDMNRPFNIKILWLVELVFVKKNGYIDSYNWN